MGPFVWGAIGVIFVVDRIRRRRRGKDLHKIPRAPGHIPFLGNIGVVKAYGNHVLHHIYEKYGNCAGEAGLLRLSVFGLSRIVTTTPRAYADVLRKTGFLRKPPASYNVFYMFGITEYSVFTHPDGDEHARVRRHMMKFFNAENVALTISELAGECLRTADIIADAAAGAPAYACNPDNRRVLISEGGDLELGVFSTGPEEGALVNAFQIASLNIISVVFKVFLEVDVMPRMDVFADTLAQANTVAAHPLQFKLLQKGLYPGGGRYRRNWKGLYEFHKEKSSKFWASVRYAYPDAMTDDAQFELAVSNLAFIYMAGYETTANAITNTLAALALDKDSQTVVAEELQSLGLLASAATPEPRAVTAEDLSKMPFLDAIVHESLRLMSPAPSGGFRLLEKDTMVSGYLLPKGTEIMLPSWTLHYNRRVWGDDASMWRPDRWLEGGSVAAARKDADGNPRFMAFLDGPSNCIGQQLALSEIKMVVAMLMSRLTLKMDAERMSAMKTVDDYAAASVTKVTLQQEGATWLRMVPRVPTAATQAAPAASSQPVPAA